MGLQVDSICNQKKLGTCVSGFIYYLSWLKLDAPLSRSVVLELSSLLGWLLGSHAALVAMPFCLNFHPIC